MEEFEEALLQTHDHLLRNFGKADVALREFQYLKRGNKEFPVRGIEDVIAAIKGELDENGRLRAIQGESYIMLIRYPEKGLPLIETVNVYGASNVEGNAHYDDQMPLYLKQQLKTMTLDINTVRKTAERIYHPK
jgi:acyl-homoserine-lactone acylase